MKKAALLLFLAAAASVAGYFAYQRSGPPPVLPAAPDGLDPLVRELVESGAAHVDARRRSAEARLRLGMAYEANGLYGEASACYEQLLALDPRDARARHRLACVEERTGDLARAVETMSLAVEADPEYAGSWARLAWWLVDLGETERAAEALDEARRRMPDAPEVRFVEVRLALAERDAEGAIERLEGGRLLEGADAAYGHYLLSLARRQLGDLEGAADAHARSDGSRFSFSDPWTREMLAFQTGYAAMRVRASRAVAAGDYGRAEPALREIVAHDPRDARSLNLLGACRLGRGDLDEAASLFERVLEVDPGDYSATVNAARVELRRRPPDATALAAAYERVGQAVERRPRDASGWRVLATLADELERPGEVVTALDRAIALEPEAPELPLKAAYTEVVLGRFDAALARFRAAQSRWPEEDEAWFGELTALVYAGRAAEARDALRTLADRPGLDAERVHQLRAAVARMQ